MSTKPLRSRVVTSSVDSCLATVAGLLALVATAACTGDKAGSNMQTMANGQGGDSEANGSGGERGDGGSDGGSTGSRPGATTGGDGGDGTTASSTASTAVSSTVTSVSASSSSGGLPEQVAEVFAHSADTLYRVDLETNTIETIGEFSGCSEIIDIALDKDSQMYGTTYGFLYRIDRTTAVCTEVAEGTFPNSLSFVPAGTLDPNAEQLVGYVDADYVRIDTASGQVTTIGTNVLSGGRVSSGDIVSVIGGPTLLTVKGGSCDDEDCVVEVDPVTGSIVEEYGTASFNNVFGIAFWDGSLYGFSSFGDAFELVPDGAGGFDPIDIPFAQTVSFYGAGSTTSAPKGILN